MQTARNACDRSSEMAMATIRVTTSGQRSSILAIVALFLLLPSAAKAQGTRADYDRASTLRRRTEGTVFKARVTPQWDADGTRFSYRNDLAGGRREFVRVDAIRGTRQQAFDHAKVAAALSRAIDKKGDAERLPIDSLHFAKDDAELRVLVAGQWWNWDGKADELTKASAPRSSAPESKAAASANGRPQKKGRPRRNNQSPDGKWVAYAETHNLYLRVRSTPGDDKPIALTTDGKADDSYTGEVFWSPDSCHLVALRRRDFPARTINLIESSPRDQLQPKLHSLSYRKPGDAVPYHKPRLFTVADGKTAEAKTADGKVAECREVAIDDTLFANPWEIDDVRWQPDSERFTFLYNQRGHQVLRIVGVDADTGHATPLVDEQSKTFIDYAHKRFAHYLDETQELIWMSERDGWNHLYLYDLRTGQVKNQITRGAWVVRGVERVDAEKRQVWFRAGGIHPGQDPYLVHFARMNFDGTGLTLVTEGNGTHDINFSPDGRFLIDTYSRVDLPPVTELRRGDDGKVVCGLEQADIAELRKLSWQMPEPFVAKGRDGQTDICGVIFRPTNFDAGKRYPVIEQIYAGPQSAFVPKSFRAYYGHQALAELGFIVVQIDGMGTSHRSKAFHDVCAKNLGDAGFPDRLLWLKAAAAKYPYLDLSRVGIYGGSAGGQNALRGLLAHGDFYKVGVADCGCHDNRMDKVWWNELWMGWPIGPHYAEQSNVTQAHRLQGKLLLIVGELDRNVDPASTMQVVNALVKANKDFDLLIIPGAGHGSAESPYGSRRRQDFFVRHLLGVEPRGMP